MSKAILQVVNTGAQTVSAGGTINLGTTTHKYGCEILQSGNGITIFGNGYFEIKTNVVVTPEAIGNITINLLNNGGVIPGATATGSVATVGDSVTLPIDFIIRRGCHCTDSNTITISIDADATIDNIVTNVEKK